MTRGARIAFLVASLFTVINLGGGVYAAVLQEWMHAAVHFGLVPLGAFVTWWIAWRGRETNTDLLTLDDRIERLQHSVEAIALEVERIGEAQRFTAKHASKLTDDVARKGQS